MMLCGECEHVWKPDGSKNPRVWLCSLFPRNECDPVTGESEPPYWGCYRVLQTVGRPNLTSPCSFFKPLPETGEPVIKESGGTKSVSFKEKETAK